MTVLAGFTIEVEGIEAPEDHLGQGIVFACFDDRLKELRRALEDSFGYAYGPSFAGGARAFLDPETAATAMKQVRLAAALHQQNTGEQKTTMILVNHMGCGEYTAAGFHFPTRRSETHAHWRHLDEAKELIEATVPNVEISCLLVDIRDDRIVAMPRP